MVRSRYPVGLSKRPFSVVEHSLLRAEAGSVTNLRSCVPRMNQVLFYSKYPFSLANRQPQKQPLLLFLDSSKRSTNKQFQHGVDCTVSVVCAQEQSVLDDAKLNAVDSSGNWTKPRIPAELLYMPFQEFLNEVQTGGPLMSCNDPRWALPQNSPGDKQQFLRDVLNFIEITAKRYPVEEDLSAELNTVFSALLGVSVKRTLTPRARGDREGNADGSYEATGFGRGVFVLIREDRLGTGSGGGDSLVELLGHYSNLLNFSPGITAPAPMVLVEVLGPRLVISLAACDELSRPSTSAAVVSHSLLIQANPTVQISLLAATFLGLRRLITTITLQKDNMPPPILKEGGRRQDRSRLSNIEYRWIPEVSKISRTLWTGCAYMVRFGRRYPLRSSWSKFVQVGDELTCRIPLVMSGPLLALFRIRQKKINVCL